MQMRPFGAGMILALARLPGQLVAAKLAVMLVFVAALPIALTLLAGLAGTVMFDLIHWVSRLVLALLGVVSPASLICGW
jgi:hypothetical protein